MPSLLAQSTKPADTPGQGSSTGATVTLISNNGSELFCVYGLLYRLQETSARGGAGRGGPMVVAGRMPPAPMPPLIIRETCQVIQSTKQKRRVVGLLLQLCLWLSVEQDPVAWVDTHLVLVL